MHSEKQIRRAPCSNWPGPLFLAGWVIARYFFAGTIIAEKWNGAWAAGWGLVQVMGRGLPAGTLTAASRLRGPVRCTRGGRAGLGGSWGTESTSGCGNLPKCTPCPHGDFENLLVATASRGLGSERQALPVPGHQKMDRLLKWLLSSVLSAMLTSSLQLQRPCIQLVQTLRSLMFQAHVLFSQITFMWLKVHCFQILYFQISILKLFRVSGCYECLNIKVEQLTENRNIEGSYRRR